MGGAAETRRTVFARIAPEGSPTRIASLLGATESIASVESSVEACVAGRVTEGLPSLRFERDRRFSAVVVWARGAAALTKTGLFGVLVAAVPEDNHASTAEASLSNVR